MVIFTENVRSAYCKVSEGEKKATVNQVMIQADYNQWLFKITKFLNMHTQEDEQTQSIILTNSVTPSYISYCAVEC